MHYLVTGGAGFIGSAFVRHLAKSNQAASITVLDSLTYAADFASIEDLISAKKIKFVKADLRHLDVEHDLLGKLDIVVNFAAETHVDRSIEDPLVFFQTNVIGTQNLLELSKKLETKLFLQVSTDEVYGSLVEGEATEDSVLMPSSPYAASKASADHLALSYCKTYGLPVVITRCTNNYGFGQHREKFLPTVISRIQNKQHIPVYGSGENVREWISVEDHVDGIIRAINGGVPGEVYNLGSGQRLSNLEIISKCVDICGEDRVQFEFVPERLGHDYRYALDSTKATRELGFKATRTLENFLETALMGGA